MKFMVMVDTRADRLEGCGVNMVGPFSQTEATAFYEQTRAFFDAAVAVHGAKAYPYGTPVLSIETIAENWSPRDLAGNWTFDRERGY